MEIINYRILDAYKYNSDVIINKLIYFIYIANYIKFCRRADEIIFLSNLLIFLYILNHYIYFIYICFLKWLIQINAGITAPTIINSIGEITNLSPVDLHLKRATINVKEIKEFDLNHPDHDLTLNLAQEIVHAKKFKSIGSIIIIKIPISMQNI
jgi:hypothetical protein